MGGNIDLRMYYVWSPFELVSTGFLHIGIEVYFDSHFQEEVSDLLLLDIKMVTFERHLIILVLNLFAQGEFLKFKILRFNGLDLFDGQGLLRNMFELFSQFPILC